MGRSGASIVMAIAREVARQQRMADAERARAIRQAEKEARAAKREEQRRRQQSIRTLKEMERVEKALYREGRVQETADLNAEVEEKLKALDRILSHTLQVDDTIAVHLAKSQPPPQESDYLSRVLAPTGLRAYLPGAKKRYSAAIASVWKTYESDLSFWQREEAKRRRELEALQDRYSKAVAAFENKKAQRNAEVDDFEQAYWSGDVDAIVAYSTMVLERSSYPDDFPRHFSVAYAALSRQLVVEFELPSVQVVPTIEEYRYVQTRDALSEKPRKVTLIKDLYQEVIASVALRTIHELLESDQGNHIEVVCFNGYVHTIDPATGRDIQPHLISVRTTKETFSEIDLARVDKRVCLKNLGAQVSRQPDEAQAVKPIIEFDMADARFIDQTDLVSGLSSATNLMELNPYEFEQLVANLFGQMGLESKLTRSSRDGGVDCVAYDRRPVLGGKVVIQAKRYRNPVGVSAVRDLFGTMMNEGANKGILVTTSGYGPDAFEFARDKPIELIEGGGLLFLLQEIGIQARIVFPEQVV